MPLVSIILPTFNRVRFLPEAFASIEGQTFKDWECIVVDDGSTDSTEAFARAWTPSFAQSVKYIKQENKGAYGARNTGLDHATGEFVAFFDSDDLWLPHHLERCVSALQTVCEAGWVFAACRLIDSTGAVVQPTSFETGTGPHPFLSLRAATIGPVHLIEDSTLLECHVTSGLYAGLQNSMIRREIFDGHRFWEDYRVVEDANFLVRALVRGVRMAYLTDVHVIYRIHDGNSSASAVGLSRDSLYRIRRENIVGTERILKELTFSPRQRRALEAALSRHYFWGIGYLCCWETGDVSGAMAAFKRGLQLNPFDVRMWKTYISCLIGAGLGLTPRHPSPPAKKSSTRTTP